MQWTMYARDVLSHTHTRPLCITCSMYGVTSERGGIMGEGQNTSAHSGGEGGSSHMLLFETSVTIFQKHHGPTHDSRTFMSLILAVLHMRPRHTAPWDFNAEWDFWAPTVSFSHKQFNIVNFFNKPFKVLAIFWLYSSSVVAVFSVLFSVSDFSTRQQRSPILVQG